MKKVISMLLAVAMLLSMSVGSVMAEPEKSGPELTSYTETLLLVDMDTEEVYYSQNEDVERAMASTTKIMTYIVTAELIKDLEHTMITIEQEPIDHIKGQNASVAGFENHIGEQYSVLDVLYGLMLPSGCDAAEILAYYIGEGDVQKFVDRMNEKAKELGCTHTHYEDAHGLSGNQTTAEDLYIITRYALTMPYFEEMVGTESYTLPGDAAPLVNTNYLIDEWNRNEYYYPYATGVKTGYTDNAGRCLVSTAVKGEKHLMCIALGGRYDAESGYRNYAMIDSANLYRWAFETQMDNIDIKLNKQYQSVQIGDQVQLKAEITENNTAQTPAITWESLDPEIAAVDENGVVTALSLGEAEIRAKTQTGNFAVCKVCCGYYTGIDVMWRYGDYTSGSKQPVDWAALKENGLDFAMIRAGYGSEDYPNQNDAAFVENVKGAVENGIPFGLNFVAYAEDAETAKLEAEYLLREIDDYIPEYKDSFVLPVAYDMMTSTQYAGYTEEQNTEIALAFNQVMKEHGYQTMCYTTKTVFGKMDVARLKAAGMGLWYKYLPYEPDFSQIMTVKEEYVPELWQYRSDGYLPQAWDKERRETRMSLIYMVSAEAEQYQAPVVTVHQIEGEKAVQLQWEAVPYAITGYSVYRQSAVRRDGQPEKIAELGPDSLTYTDTDLEWNDSYTYFVAAKAADYLDATYYKEITGAADSAVTVQAPPEETTKPGDSSGETKPDDPSEEAMKPGDSTEETTKPDSPSEEPTTLSGEDPQETVQPESSGSDLTGSGAETGVQFPAVLFLLAASSAAVLLGSKRKQA